MIASFWPSPTNITENLSFHSEHPRIPIRVRGAHKRSSVEPHLDIRPLFQVYRIDEPHLPLVQRQNHGASAHSFPEKLHAFQQVYVRHARARENHFLPR